MTEAPLDITQFESAPPDEPDLDGLAAQGVPAEDPGPDGDLTIDADGEV